jgi:hypothetical protein
MAWMDQRPDRRGYFADYMQQHPYGGDTTSTAHTLPAIAPMPPSHAPGAPPPAAVPQTGVGTSLGVVGMTPATSPFGLPAYGG